MLYADLSKRTPGAKRLVCILESPSSRLIFKALLFVEQANGPKTLVSKFQ